MCLAIPGRVRSVKGEDAQVEYPGEIRSVRLLDRSIHAGDWVIVQNKVIVMKVPEEEVTPWKEMLSANS